jgi:hypothetical protein
MTDEEEIHRQAALQNGRKPLRGLADLQMATNLPPDIENDLESVHTILIIRYI